PARMVSAPAPVAKVVTQSMPVNRVGSALPAVQTDNAPRTPPTTIVVKAAPVMPDTTKATARVDFPAPKSTSIMPDAVLPAVATGAAPGTNVIAASKSDVAPLAPSEPVAVAKTLTGIVDPDGAPVAIAAPPAVKTIDEQIAAAMPQPPAPV